MHNSQEQSGSVDSTLCKICGSPSHDAGRKYGHFKRRWFHLRHCDSCHYSFVADPWTDYSEIYTASYYEGRGPDPSVDYIFELDHPDESVRMFEWSGIVTAVRALVSLNRGSRWLDYGCGNGGLVRYCRKRGYENTIGFEEGFIRNRALSKGIPVIGRSELNGLDGSFDVVTAIEVLEHVQDPISVLQHIRRLLKPGGLLFLTTGNATRYRGNLANWSYVLPEVHISYFEPKTLAIAMKAAGLRPEFHGYIPGFKDILRFKVLKGLRVRRRNIAERLIPWTIVSLVADYRHAVSAQPVGRALERLHQV